MIDISRRRPASPIVGWTVSHLKQLQSWPAHSVVIGEICFVLGWSTMWATALGIVPHLPSVVWLTMMGFGLVFANCERSFRRVLIRTILRPARHSFLRFFQRCSASAAVQCPSNPKNTGAYEKSVH
jgi:hypothetical protein